MSAWPSAWRYTVSIVRGNILLFLSLLPRLSDGYTKFFPLNLRVSRAVLQPKPCCRKGQGASMQSLGHRGHSTNSTSVWGTLAGRAGAAWRGSVSGGPETGSCPQCLPSAPAKGMSEGSPCGGQMARGLLAD